LNKFINTLVSIFSKKIVIITTDNFYIGQVWLHCNLECMWSKCRWIKGTISEMSNVWQSSVR